MPTPLTANFTLEELVASKTANDRGINNQPSDDVIAALRQTADLLEKIRSLLGNRPMTITSGYRCLDLNRALGSKDDSDHIKGLAADFVCPGFGSPPAICQAIAASPIEFRQLIDESNSAGDQWVHIAAGTGRQLLTINANGVRFGLG